MANVILISDGEKHPWHEWLNNELTKRNHSLFNPEMPSIQEGINSWIEALKDYRKYLDEDAIIIAHGAGRVIALKILEEKLREMAGAIFISGKPINQEFNDFSFEELDFEMIKNKAKAFFIYGSENDDAESLKESETLAKLLDDEVLILEDNKYFKNQEKFEDLLIDVISLTDA